jgi:hypothetical protein
MRVVAKPKENLVWYLGDKKLKGRKPLDHEQQLPEEFFWSSNHLTVVYEDGEEGQAALVTITWDKQPEEPQEPDPSPR